MKYKVYYTFSKKSRTSPGNYPAKVSVAYAENEEGTKFLFFEQYILSPQALAGYKIIRKFKGCYVLYDSFAMKADTFDFFIKKLLGYD